MVRRREVGPPAVEVLDRHRDARRRELVQVAADELLDLLRLLVRHEATADLRRGARGDDRLSALVLEAAGDAVAVERRPRPGALERAEPLLARDRRRARRAQPLLLVEGQRRDLLPLRRRGL